MTFTQFALHMYPYWIIGILIICSVMATKQRDLLRINKSALLRWLRFLINITIVRVLLYKLFPDSFMFHSVKEIAPLMPIGVGFTVFWEDMVHGLPLVILRRLIGVNKWTRPLHMLLMLLVMIEFGLGHTYQGLFPAICLSFYIPYSVKIAEKHGFGTVMIGHMMYDLFAMFFIKYLTGL